MKSLLFSMIVLACTTFLSLCQQDTIMVTDSVCYFTWDSQISQWKNQYKIYNSYDARGNLDKIIIFIWDPVGNVWINAWYHRISRTFSGNLTESQSYNWDEISGTWKGSHRLVSNYNSEGKPVEDINYSWDEVNYSWKMSRMNQNTWDTLGNQTGRITYNWAAETEEWVKESRLINSYDTSRNMIESLNYSWNINTNVWDNSSLTTYLYDSTGNQIEMVFSNWDSNAGKWIDYYRINNGYNSSGNMIETRTYLWDTETISWKAEQYNTNEFDFYGKVTESISYQWNTESNKWIPVYRTSNSYDANGNIIEYISYNWDTANQIWTYQGRNYCYFSEIIYNPELPLSISLQPEHISGIGVNDGSINLCINGGFKPYSINWSNGSSSEDINQLEPGVYSVKVTDSTNQKVYDSIRIYETFMDASEVKRYKAITIQRQVWMAENLNTGYQIQGSLTQSDNQITEKYCYLDEPAYCDTFGGLYQWDEMMQYAQMSKIKGICPTGWHLPGDVEWKQLEMALGMTKEEADKWADWRGTDQGDQIKIKGSSGFEALFSGTRSGESPFSFKFIGQVGKFWTSDPGVEYSTNAIERTVAPGYNGIQRSEENIYAGLSVRCIRNADPIKITYKVMNTSSFGNNDGYIQLNVKGGVGEPYTFLWSNGSVAKDISQLSEGLYSVVITDTENNKETFRIRIYDTFIDERDTIRYKAVRIGNQIWMAENLKAIRYSDNTPLIDGTGIVDNYDDQAKYYFKYSNDFNIEGNPFGALYNWKAAMNGESSSSMNPSSVQGICPCDWHLPSESEWRELIDYVKSQFPINPGEKLTTEELWYNLEMNDLHPDNYFGINLAPGSYAGDNNDYLPGGTGHFSYYWTATETSSNAANALTMFSSLNPNIDSYYKKDGFAVRCLKNIPLALSLEPVHLSSLTGNDGSIKSKVWGGKPPYSYKWSNGSSTETLSKLSPDVYSLTVTDALDSIITDSIRIYATFIDQRDNRIYKAISMGDQLWMAENLNLSTESGSAYYNNDSNLYSSRHGRLYNFNIAIESCPQGWDLPSDSVWKELEKFLGMNDTEINKYNVFRGTDEGNMMKEGGGAGIEINLSGKKNYPVQLFQDIDTFGFYWTSTQLSGNLQNGIFRQFGQTEGGIRNNDADKNVMLSVRCYRNLPLEISFCPKHVSAYFGNDGSIVLNVTGGVPPYKYTWSNGSSSEDISGLSAGLYSVTVNDSRNNTIEDSIRIYDTFLDTRDNKRYKIITIGTQTWMAENLKVATNSGSWYYNNDSIVYFDLYGRLYDWATAMNLNQDYNYWRYYFTSIHQGNCPAGWHIPGMEEWEDLIKYIGENGYPGKEGLALKSIKSWISGNGLDAFGFDALPGGRYSGGKFEQEGMRATFWSTSQDDINQHIAEGKNLRYNTDLVPTYITNKAYALSVRCIKDIPLLPTGIPKINLKPELRNEIKIYPNPASDIIFIELSESIKHCKIEILDLFGRTHKVVNNTNNLVMIKITDFKKGVYLLRISKDQDLFNTMIVIE